MAADEIFASTELILTAMQFSSYSMKNHFNVLALISTYWII
jgi:hypothetical protein